MKILVRRQGFGVLKPPEDIPKLLPQENNEVKINPKWFEYHRDQPLVRAVDFLDRDLEVGEHDAKLTYQYYSDAAKSWFTTKDMQNDIFKGIPIRLVFVKEYNLPVKVSVIRKCNNCKVPLYDNEAKESTCEYCRTSEEGTRIMRKEFSKTAIL